MLLLGAQVVKDVKVQAHGETIDNSSNSKAVSTASGYKYNKHYWHTNNQNKPSIGNDASLNEGNTSNNTDATINNKFMAEVEQAIFNKVNDTFSNTYRIILINNSACKLINIKSKMI